MLFGNNEFTVAKKHPRTNQLRISLCLQLTNHAGSDEVCCSYTSDVAASLFLLHFYSREAEASRAVMVTSRSRLVRRAVELLYRTVRLRSMCLCHTKGTRGHAPVPSVRYWLAFLERCQLRRNYTTSDECSLVTCLLL